MNSFVLLLALTALTGLESCIDLEPPCTTKINATLLSYIDTNRLASDGQTIDNWLAANNLTAEKDQTGLRYTITKQGTGKAPCLESAIAFTYTGKFLSNGNVFDSASTPVEYPLTNLIIGWQIGMLKLKEGATATFYIPSELAYGSAGNAVVPPNSILIFEIGLVKVKL
ncbi:MAG: FKBP-type peptidyl-prolyl cis-trans isomerase [Bacteroidota bacterium]